MARCPDCSKFIALEYGDEYEEVMLLVSEEGAVFAEYEFTLMCPDCGTGVLTGSANIDENGAAETVQAYIDLIPDKIQEARDLAEAEYLAGNKKATQEGLRKAADAAEAQIVERAGDEAEERYITAKELDGWGRDQVERECVQGIGQARDQAMEHEFEATEESVNVYEDTKASRKTWIFELTVKITDNYHPEWEGAKVVVKDTILQSDMEEA